LVRAICRSVVLLCKPNAKPNPAAILSGAIS
jgi:hypothetical protein